MKNVSLALNAVLLIAVGVLYFLYFSGSKSNSSASNGPAVPSKIAFVNEDSLLENYDLTKERRDIFEAKGKRLEQDLKNRANSLQAEFENYQRNRGSLTIGQAQAIEEDLTRKQQNFQMFQQSVQQEIYNDQDKLSKELYENVSKYLKKYGTENGLQYILKFSTASDVLYAGDSLDITKQVIDGLNAEYKESKGVKPDTTATKKK